MVDAIGFSYDDLHSYNYYDAQGNLVAQVTSVHDYLWWYGQVTVPDVTFFYQSSDGRLAMSYSYEYATDYLTFSEFAADPSLENLRALSLNNGPEVAFTLTDDAGRVILSQDSTNGLRQYSYDSSGNLLSDSSWPWLLTPDNTAPRPMHSRC